MAEKTSIIRIKLLGGKETDDELRRLEKTLNQVRQSRKRLNKARKENKITNDQLAKTQSRLNLRYKVASQRLRDLQNSQLRATGALRKARTVGDSVVTSMGKLALRFAGVAVAVMVFKNVINTFKKFQQANADLASILGKTRAEISDLTEDAKRLGSTTAFTASEVSKLQKEFAKLGFNEKEIKNATKSTLALAAATGTDLARAAEVVGSNIRAFGLDASESQRVVDVMAMSFSSSALDMEKFATAMRSVAPVAKNAGLTIEQTTSQIGILVDRGVDASTAGTALRNIFLELAKSGMTAEEAFEMINTSANKNATALELFGKRGATVATILAENGDQALILEGKLNGAGGAAQRMADTQLDTLDGKLTILNSAWEGFILSLDSGDGAISGLVGTLAEFATGILGALSSTKTLTDEFYEQKQAVVTLETEVMPLVDRMEELEKQTELSVEEQEELDKIIQQIAKHIPSAITELDKYGKVIAVSAEASRAFHKQTKAILKLKHADAIRENKDEIEAFERRQRLLFKTLEKVNGEWRNNTQIMLKTGKILFDNSKADLTQVQRKLVLKASLQEEIEIRKAIIAGMLGEKSVKEKLAEAEREHLQLSARAVALGLAKTATLNDIIEAENKLKAAKEEGIELTEKEIKDAESRAKKLADIRKKETDEAIRETQRLAQLQQDIIKQLDIAEIANIQDKQEREEEQRLFQFEQRILNLSEDKEFEAELIKELEEKLEADLFMINKKWGENEDAELKKRQDKKLQDIVDELAAIRSANAAKIAIVGTTNNTLASINEASLSMQLLNVEEGSTREHALLKRAANRRKALAIVEVGVNLAKELSAINAAAAANPTNAVTFGAAGISQATVLYILAIAKSVANVAMIASQKFAKGGIANGGVFQGNSHANGGIPFSVGGVGFEAEGGEAIINKRSTKRYRPLLSAINQAGGGVRFGHGGVTFQDGGIQAPTSAIDAISDNGGMNDNFAETLASSINAQIASTRVINVVSDTTEAQTSVANAESEATFG